MRRVFFATPHQAGAHTTAPLVAITVGEVGYREVHIAPMSPEALNPEGTTPEVIQSAIAASMFGWHVPAAKPCLAFVRSLAQCDERRAA